MSICAVLALHVALVVLEGMRCSPTVDELAHLVAGKSYWQLGTFDLYRVNPPIVRVVAAAPLLLFEPRLAWAGLSDDPYSRAEFSLAGAFQTANGKDTLFYLRIARLACVPFSVIGAMSCYFWAQQLYGRRAGFLALALWCFCPNVIGNAALITPDLPATALGALAGYRFSKWIANPTYANTAFAGCCLGLAALTKSTWIILFAIWPALTFLAIWTVTTFKTSHASSSISNVSMNWRIGIVRLSLILSIGFYLINTGYGFEMPFRSLGEFRFVSQLLGGQKAVAQPGNRFVATVFGDIPVPLPANFLLGLDTQRLEFENGKWCYLRGAQRFGGWWYFYLYAWVIKIPIGTHVLSIAATAIVVTRLSCRQRDNKVIEYIVLAPGVALAILVMSQIGFTRYFRYILPCAPFVYVWTSQVVSEPMIWMKSAKAGRTNWNMCAFIYARRIALRMSKAKMLFATACCVLSVVSSLSVCPHSLSYFNELVLGPQNGAHHLLDANIDWGQDLMFFEKWYVQHPEARPMHLSYFGRFSPRHIGLNLSTVPGYMPEYHPHHGPVPGWHAISVNLLYGYRHDGFEIDEFAYLRAMQPVARAGYSILIFHLTRDEASRIRDKMNSSTTSAENTGEPP